MQAAVAPTVEEVVAVRWAFLELDQAQVAQVVEPFKQGAQTVVTLEPVAVAA